MIVKRIAAVLTAGICLFGTAPVVGAESTIAETSPMMDTASVSAVTAKSYADYLEECKEAGYPQQEICVPGGAGLGEANTPVTAPVAFEGKENVLQWQEAAGSVTWEVVVEEAGLYSLELTYYPLPGKNGKLEYRLAINGVIPFSGAESFSFDRCWRDQRGEDDAFNTDYRGNELAPEQTEQPRWMTKAFSDSEGLYTKPYSFYFKAGRNTITLTCIREVAVIGQLRLYQPEENPTYTAPTDPSGAPSGYLAYIQAEKPTAKSDSSIRPYSEKSDPINDPFDVAVDLLNVVGGSTWSAAGQWIEWEFTVPSDGYYQLAFRYRQNAVRGLFTSRRILIDGQVPCKEMEAVRFLYDNDWVVMVLGEETPVQLYLTAGRTHTIRMEVTLGETAPILRELQDYQQKLNGYYRRIVMITGTNPDLYRDYRLEDEIPELLSTFQDLSGRMRSQAKKLETMSGFSGSEAVLLYRIAEQLDSFREAPYSIPERLANFRENVSGLASWLTGIQGQPLELDYLAVMSPDAALPAASGGFWRKLWAGVQAFFYSFVTDYNSIGESSRDALEVWVGTGIDQMNILKRLADDSFFGTYQIPVQMKLVSSSLLLQAVMAGVGPDVALNVERTQPVNLALRGALVPLDGFEGFGAVSKRFMPTATAPYTLEGHTYGLPETQAFNMLFYRQDILDELGLAVPETWEDVYRIAPILQRHNMEIGLPADVYNMLLLQKGGDFYNPEHTQLMLHEDVPVAAFEEWVEFYTQYNFSLFKDDYNRFRTGEMPLTIMSYAFYCQLVIAAPEIRGQWSMTQVPGIQQEDGTILRTESATAGTASILLADSQKKEEGWRFLDWWTSDEVQATFGWEVESIVGTAARYTSANTEAVKRLPWSDTELELLFAQWENVRELPEVPGGYYVTRNIDNAFRACVYRGENPREMLLKWTAETNKEITRKRKEYGLS